MEMRLRGGLPEPVGDGAIADGLRAARHAVHSLRGPSDERGGVTFTHNLDLARRCDRIIEVVDGRIQG